MPLFTNEIQSTDLDVRDLTFAQDKVDATGSAVSVTGSVAVTGPLTDAQLRATAVPVTIPTPVPVTDNGGSLTVDGSVSITGTVSTTVGGTALATVTSVSVGTSATTLSASNAAKTKVIVFNDQGTLYVKLGSGASSSSYSWRVTASSALEINGYTGLITAIKASGTTSVLVTEMGI